MTAALQALAGRFGEAVGPGQVAQLSRYLELLLTWNRAINLTGAQSADELIIEHLPDSFAVARLLGPAASLVDVGSGGGLPGVPLAILRPALAVTLSEPRAKRRAFLSQAVHQLGLNAVVTPARADELPAGAFGVAVARAVLPPSEWVQAGTPLVAPEGRVLVLLPAESQWSPPPGVRLVDEVRYSAGPRQRLALAFSVSRGT